LEGYETKVKIILGFSVNIRD